MSRPTTYAQALNTALRDALTEDENVLVLGEDVGQLGGVFRITDGLTRDFGEDRCIDTPLAEAGIAGFAVGLAMQGFRPVIEMQFDAFGYPAFEQVVSHVAKMRNRTQGRMPMPMVIRYPYAGGIGGVEHHCDSSEGYYVHTPGVKVAIPSTPADAKGLLAAAIRDPDPDFPALARGLERTEEALRGVRRGEVEEPNLDEDCRGEADEVNGLALVEGLDRTRAQRGVQPQHFAAAVEAGCSAIREAGVGRTLEHERQVKIDADLVVHHLSHDALS